MNLFDSLPIINGSQGLAYPSSQFQPQIPSTQFPQLNSYLDSSSQICSNFTPNGIQASQLQSCLQQVQNPREQYRLLLLNELNEMIKFDNLQKSEAMTDYSSNNSLFNLTQNQPKNDSNLLEILLNIQNQQGSQSLNLPQSLHQPFRNDFNQFQQSSLNHQQSQIMQQQYLQSQPQQQNQIQQLLGNSNFISQSFLPQVIPQNNQLLNIQQSTPQQLSSARSLIEKQIQIREVSSSQTKIVGESACEQQQQQQLHTPEIAELEKKRKERLIKIEKYKNKRRNWLRKISYDCRKKVADSRLRIKGRFISKKDTEKIKELVGDNKEAFNSKKNLRLDFMNTQMGLQNEIAPAVSKNEILYNIEQLLLKAKEIHTSQTMQQVIKKIQKKQILFCLLKRGQTEIAQLSLQQQSESQDSSLATSPSHN